MNIFVYSDESGVFDAAHNDIFVFGGVLFLDKESKDANARKFVHAERFWHWSKFWGWAVT